MTNYIIDPAVFYWINVLGHMQTALAVIGGCAICAFIVLFSMYLYKSYYLSEPEEQDKNGQYGMSHYQLQMADYKKELKNLRMTRKYMIITLIAGSLMILASVFIPGKQTSVEMLVAKTVTFDNVDWTVQQVKEIVDYIVSALKGAV